MIGHAQAITENGAACDSAGGIDGGYGDLEILPSQVSNGRIDQRRFAAAGGTG